MAVADYRHPGTANPDLRGIGTEVRWYGLQTADIDRDPMSNTVPDPDEFDQIRWAYRHLEHPSFAARLSNVIGTPIEKTLNLLPTGWHQRVDRAARSSIGRAVRAAIRTLEPTTPAVEHQARDRFHKIAAATTGAIGGLFGPLALIIELPVVTLFMLRSIADIAHSEGEDLGSMDTRLACVEVFALGGRSAEDDATDTGYYGIRATLAFHFAGVVDFRGSTVRGIPAGMDLIRGIAGRFGAVVSDEAALQLVPVIGAVSGALLNLIFMQHFQDVARGHFILRRLERKYGSEAVRHAYGRAGREEAHAARGFSPLEGW